MIKEEILKEETFYVISVLDLDRQYLRFGISDWRFDDFSPSNTHKMRRLDEAKSMLKSIAKGLKERQWRANTIRTLRIEKVVVQTKEITTIKKV